MTKYDRIEQEKKFHDDRFKNKTDKRGILRKYYNNARIHTNYYEQIVSHLCSPNNELLEYGCGVGERALLWAEKEINVTGIDISRKGIEVAKKKRRK